MDDTFDCKVREGDHAESGQHIIPRCAHLQDDAWHTQEDSGRKHRGRRPVSGRTGERRNSHSCSHRSDPLKDVQCSVTACDKDLPHIRGMTNWGTLDLTDLVSVEVTGSLVLYPVVGSGDMVLGGITFHERSRQNEDQQDQTQGGNEADQEGVSLDECS